MNNGRLPQFSEAVCEKSFEQRCSELKIQRIQGLAKVIQKYTHLSNNQIPPNQNELNLDYNKNIDTVHKSNYGSPLTRENDHYLQYMSYFNDDSGFATKNASDENISVSEFDLERDSVDLDNIGLWSNSRKANKSTLLKSKRSQEHQKGSNKAMKMKSVQSSKHLYKAAKKNSLQVKSHIDVFAEQCHSSIKINKAGINTPSSNLQFRRIINSKNNEVKSRNSERMYHSTKAKPERKPKQHSKPAKKKLSTFIQEITKIKSMKKSDCHTLVLNKNLDFIKCKPNEIEDDALYAVSFKKTKSFVAPVDQDSNKKNNRKKYLPQYSLAKSSADSSIKRTNKKASPEKYLHKKLVKPRDMNYKETNANGIVKKYLDNKKSFNHQQNSSSSKIKKCMNNDLVTSSGSHTFETQIQTNAKIQESLENPQNDEFQMSPISKYSNRASFKDRESLNVDHWMDTMTKIKSKSNQSTLNLRVKDDETPTSAKCHKVSGEHKKNLFEDVASVASKNLDESSDCSDDCDLILFHQVKRKSNQRTLNLRVKDTETSASAKCHKVSGECKKNHFEDVSSVASKNLDESSDDSDDCDLLLIHQVESKSNQSTLNLRVKDDETPDNAKCHKVSGERKKNHFDDSSSVVKSKSNQRTLNLRVKDNETPASAKCHKVSGEHKENHFEDSSSVENPKNELPIVDSGEDLGKNQQASKIVPSLSSSIFTSDERDDFYYFPSKRTSKRNPLIVTKDNYTCKLSRGQGSNLVEQCGTYDKDHKLSCVTENEREISRTFWELAASDSVFDDDDDDDMFNLFKKKNAN